VINEIDISDIAVEGYTFLFPLVMMEVTRRQISAGDRRTPEQKAANIFVHNHAMANDKWRSVARTNIDTLFSSAWIDLSEGPATITFPPAGDRYHMFQMLDMWTDTYAVVGSRTLGQNGGTITVVGPAHAMSHRSTASDIVIHCPTPTTWIIGRTYAQNGPDLQNAVEFVDGIVATSPYERCFNNDLSYPGDESPKIPPATKVRNLSGEQFFEFAAHLLSREGIRNTDGSIALRLRALGFIPGQPFNVASLSTEVRNAIADAPRAFNEFLRTTQGGRTAGPTGWSIAAGDIGTYGNSYLIRAFIALIGIGANPPVDALYIHSVADADENVIDGEHTYRIHFENGKLPPARAFWSITAYDHEGFMMPNRLDRFGIRSRDEVEFNNDGSLDIYLAPECPSSAPEKNWIPTLPGRVSLSIRRYSPPPESLDGSWQPPAIQRIN
jgi:hypothetical protein